MSEHRKCASSSHIRRPRPGSDLWRRVRLPFMRPCAQVLGSDASNWVAAGSLAPFANTSAAVVDQDSICFASTGDEQFMFLQNNCTEVRCGSLLPLHTSSWWIPHGCVGAVHDDRQ